MISRAVGWLLALWVGCFILGHWAAWCVRMKGGTMKKIRLCFELPDMSWPIKLEQRGRDNFRVSYGKDITDHLHYGEAAEQLGKVIMHALACDDRLDNGMSRADRRIIGNFS